MLEAHGKIVAQKDNTKAQHVLVQHKIMGDKIILKYHSEKDLGA